MRELRQAQNLTQQEVADAIEVSRSTVAMWESGKSKPLFSNIVKLSGIYKCTVEKVIESLKAG